MDFLGDSVVKNMLVNAGDVGSIPGPGRSPKEGNGKPLQYSCLENPMDRGAWEGRKELDTAEQLHFTSGPRRQKSRLPPEFEPQYMLTVAHEHAK